MKEDRLDNQCITFADHEINWAGDGYFCSLCDLQFVPATERTKAAIEELEKLLSQVACTKDNALIENRIANLQERGK